MTIFKVPIILLLVLALAQTVCTSAPSYQYDQYMRRFPYCQAENFTEQKPYILEGNRFRLSVNMTQEKLTIILEDFIEWVIYGKQYTDDDIGQGQINRKSNILDIYNIITQKIGLDNEKQEKDLSHLVQILQEHKNEEVIYANKKNSYNIQNGGKIKINLKLRALNFKSQISCDSHLKLTKLKEMSQVQILTARLRIQQNIFQNQIAKLKQEHKIYEKQLTQTKQLLKIQRQNYVSCQNQIKNINQKHYNENYWSNFNVGNNNTTTIEYLGNNAWTNFIIVEPISSNSIYEFKIRIIKSATMDIFIGVVDCTKQRQRSYFRSSLGNAIAYYGKSGYKLSEKRPYKTEGPGFSEGETVDVIVDLPNKIIKWSVNGQQRASYAHQMLGDKSRLFMPFVEMFNKNDMVQFIK